MPLILPECYWVVPRRFLAGEYPGALATARATQKLKTLIDYGIRTFVNLTEAFEPLEPYLPLLERTAAEAGVPVRHLHHGIRDASIPTRDNMRQILDAIEEHMAAGGVYLHCWGGVGRTGTVVGCWLVRHGMSGEQALAQLDSWWQTMPKRRWHPRSPETMEQCQFVLQWPEGGNADPAH